MISLPKSKGSDYTTRPTGDLVIPATVTYNDVTYNVTSIGHYAFANCSGLTSITIYAENPPTLGNNVFNGVRSNINVNVPCGKQMLYYARWTHFSNFIGLATFPPERWW